MIPKVIHYCWFGGNPLPDLAQKCIESWKKFCPDYEIVRWDESNFDVNQNDYCREAYESKKWAFVSDYARLKVLYEYGGIYMDTDVEVTKNLDSFLSHKAFSGFEDKTHIPTGIMASEKNGEWMKLLLSYYDGRRFILENGDFDFTTNITSITNMTLAKYPLDLNNQFQEIEGVFAIYPSEYFCPKDYSTRKLNITNNTHTIHHYDGSWVGEEWRWRSTFIHKYHKYLGRQVAKTVSVPLYYLKNRDVCGMIKATTKRLKRIKKRVK